jgi:hypothetical protein
VLAVCALGCLGATSAQAATPAWQPIAAVNPSYLWPKRSETQRLVVNATGGTFKIKVHRRGYGRGVTHSTTTVTDAITFFNLGGKGEFIPGQTITNTFGSYNSETKIEAVNGSVLTLSKPAKGTSVLVRGDEIEADMTISESTGAAGTGELTAGSPTVANLLAEKKHLLAKGAGNLTAGSAEVTSLATYAGEFLVGKAIEGEGIPSGTTIVAVEAGKLTLSNPVEAGKTKAGVELTSKGASSFVVGEAISGAGIPAGATIAAVSEAEHKIVLSAAVEPGGTASGVSLTANIPAGASAETLEAALDAALPLGGSVSVSGGGGEGNQSIYLVTFGGNLANKGIGAMEVDSSGLTGTGAAATDLVTERGGRGVGTLFFYAQNVGGATSTSATVTATITLPSGIGASRTPYSEGPWSCAAVEYGERTLTCTTTETAGPGEPLGEAITVPIETSESSPSVKTIEMSVSGGGDPTPATPGPQCPGCEFPLTISSLPVPPGIQSFNAEPYDENGNIATRAGSHPYLGATAFFLNTAISPVNGRAKLVGEFKDIDAYLAPGFLGNPIAVPQCPPSELGSCDKNTAIGKVRVALGGTGGATGALGESNIFDVEAPDGYPGAFYFQVGEEGNTEPVHVTGSLRSEEDYGLTVGSHETTQIAPVFGSFFTFWGAPGGSEHDSQRHGPYVDKEGHPLPVTAFLTMPTNCAEEAEIPPSVRLEMNTWQAPFEFHLFSQTLKPVTECDNLHFEDNFTFEPSDTKSDSTASFRTSLTVPSEGLTNPSKLTTPELKKAVVQLPKGVVLNASGADGLQACSEQQIGFKGASFPMPNPMRFSKDPQTCPEASKIGTGELKTALLTDPLHGALYLAAQGKGNPFGSLFAIYLVIEDPRHGIFIKLPGEVEPDPVTGQMQVTFDNLPQLPFTRLDLNLKGGNRSALASPTTCGQYTTTAIGTPWSYPESGPPTETSNGFEINQGPNGEPCAPTPAARPFDLGWSAGAEKTQAGASGPFDLQITRPDGSQELEALQLQTPQGLSASLKGIPYCTEAEIKQIEASTGRQEQERPACPSASQVGTAVTGAGAGPTPFYTNGKLYLAGPYKGAPISVLAVTPAVAGPFDLGNVVVRSAVFIDRQTAQVTAKTDPIPQILKGVVLRIKDVRIHLDRKDWTINPTSCEPMSSNLTAHGNSGAVANKSARFQVGGCNDLAFKPKLTAKVTGGTKRNDHPSFKAEVTYPEGPGYANLKDIQVSLPHSEFLDQSHINTVCTRAQATAHECPAGSIYGEAEATTPLLDGVLKGPVFLKSSVHKLPDLAIALKGPDNQPIEVEFAGRIDSVHGQIRNTIEGLPDVPVTKFVLNMKGGRKGLLVNSRDLCKGKQTKMTVDTIGQNNKRYDTRPKLGNSCGQKAKRHKKSHKRQQLSVLRGGW